MSILSRLLRSAAISSALGIAFGGCNFVLGINEPEEITSPPVRYYPWDGASWDEADAPAPLDAADASDASDAAVDMTRPTPDATFDARIDTGRTCTNVPAPNGSVCGEGCGSLCPLNSACLKDSDCTSNKCFGARCTLPSCINGVKDGQETDVDCGGLCGLCGTGRGCRVSADCRSRACTNGSCEAPPVDAGPEVKAPQDGSNADASARPDSSAASDAALVPDAALMPDADGNVFVDSSHHTDSADADDASDAAEMGAPCDAGCSLCACTDGE